MASQKAVAGESGRRKMFISEDSTGGHSLLPSLSGAANTTVETISLKDLFDLNAIPEADFLKMDCEGSEHEVFFSAPDDVLRKIKKLAIEWHYLDAERNVETLRSHLQVKGFTVTHSKRGKVGMLYAKRA